MNYFISYMGKTATGQTFGSTILEHAPVSTGEGAITLFKFAEAVAKDKLGTSSVVVTAITPLDR